MLQITSNNLPRFGFWLLFKMFWNSNIITSFRTVTLLLIKWFHCSYYVVIDCSCWCNSRMTTRFTPTPDKLFPRERMKVNAAAEMCVDGAGQTTA